MGSIRCFLPGEGFEILTEDQSTASEWIRRYSVDTRSRDQIQKSPNADISAGLTIGTSGGSHPIGRIGTFEGWRQGASPFLCTTRRPFRKTVTLLGYEEAVAQGAERSSQGGGSYERH